MKGSLEELADFMRWRETSPAPHDFTLFDYASAMMTPDMFFAFASIFCPPLVEHDGLHFVGETVSAEHVSTYEAWRSQGLSGREIQRVMNHKHITSIVQQGEMSLPLAVATARTLAHIWNHTLAEHGVFAEVIGEDDLADLAVTIYDHGR